MINTTIAQVSKPKMSMKFLINPGWKEIDLAYKSLKEDFLFLIYNDKSFLNCKLNKLQNPRISAWYTNKANTKAIIEHLKKL